MTDFFQRVFGGSGPTTTQTNSADAFSQPLWQNYLSGLNATLQNNPITPYGGPTVAPQNFMQQTANDMGYNLATGGSPAGNMANSAIVAQASGAVDANPYATTLNPYLNSGNPYVGQNNPYQGDNPYLQAQIDAANKDITRAYSEGTAAQTDAAFNNAGAYGGSAYGEQVARNQNELAKNLAQADTGLRYQNYLNSGNIAGQDLVRNQAGYQNVLGLNAQLGENQLNRSTGAYQNALQQQLQAAQLGLQSQGLDWNSIMGLNQLGGQQQNYQQQLLNAMQNYYSQAQQAPYIGYDIFGNALSRYSNANSVQTAQGPGSNPYLNAIGGIGSLYNLFGGGG